MSSRGNVEEMKLKGTVKNGVVAVDLPEGMSVTIEVDPRGCSMAEFAGLGQPLEYDGEGNVVVTPELETAFRQADADARAGLGITVDELERRLRNARR